MQTAPFNLFAGTSGWAYATWKPGFYPKPVPAKNFLAHYGTQLNSVEVNFTFRALPSATQIGNWLAAVPENFRFSFKAPQAITHIRRLKEESAPALEAFFASIEPARQAGKLGCVLFQLPPNFKADNDRLAAFLALPEMKLAPPLAFEFRNATWFTQQTYALLAQHNAAVCIAESEDIVTPESFTADFSVYRLRMPGGYSQVEVDAFAQKFATLASQRTVYAYFKHEDEPTGPLAATAMLHQVRAQ